MVKPEFHQFSPDKMSDKIMKAANTLKTFNNSSDVKITSFISNEETGFIIHKLGYAVIFLKTRINLGSWIWNLIYVWKEAKNLQVIKFRGKWTLWKIESNICHFGLLLACSQTLYFLFKVRRARVIENKPQGIYWPPAQWGSGGGKEKFFLALRARCRALASLAGSLMSSKRTKRKIKQRLCTG